MAIKVTSGSTVANTAATVALTQAWPNVTVINRSGGELWVRTDGVAPTVAGDECFLVLVGGSITLPVPGSNEVDQAVTTQPATTSVGLISGAAVTYTVIGVD